MLHLHYGWTLMNTPSHCVHGVNFSTDHVMMSVWWLNFCLPQWPVRYTAELLSKVCCDVTIESPLQPLSGTVIIITPRSANWQDDTRANIYAYGFWGSQQRYLFDTRVFHPNTQSYCNTYFHSFTAQMSWASKDERLWWLCPWSGASLLYFPGLCNNWWHEQGSPYLLLALGTLDGHS